MNIRGTLKERGDRYGAFEDHAELCQSLKEVMRQGRSWTICTDSQKQALEVIADKIARMLNGEPNYDDNWVDIIGYSQLVLDELHRDAEGQSLIDFDIPSKYENRIVDGRDSVWDGYKWIEEGSIAHEKLISGQTAFPIGAISEGGDFIFNGGGEWLYMDSTEGAELYRKHHVVSEELGKGLT